MTPTTDPPTPDAGAPVRAAPGGELAALQRAVAGRYSLVRELGRGGAAVVFLARDLTLGRLVAIKLLRAELVADPRARDRFLREARTAARMVHPHIVPVHAVEEAGDLVFLVMAYVEGESLGRRVRRAGPLSPMAVRQVVQEVAWALAEAHAAGVIHLDVKPDNILLERATGRALLTDFGIARLQREAGADGSRAGAADAPAGTPRYMSPEQLAGGPVDGRSDLYALGVTAVFSLTASWPRRDDTSGGASGRAGWEEGVPPALARAIRRCLAPDPAARPASAADLAAEIAEAEALPFHLPVAGRRMIREMRQFVLIGAAGAVPLMLWPEVLVFVGAGCAAILLSRLGRSARSLARQGYDAELLRDVLAEEVRGLFPERAEADGWWSRAVVRVRSALIRGGPALAVLGVSGAAALWFLGPALEPVGIAAAAAVVATLLVGAGPKVSERSPLRHLDWAERMLVGRFGRALMWVAGAGLSAPDRERRVADRPTEVLLASAAEELFGALPGDLRSRLPDLPEVARRLERHVAALRERDRRLAEAIDRIGVRGGAAVGVGGPQGAQASAELDRARADVDRRLREAVAALEHLRLALFRLATDRTDLGVRELEHGLERARELERTGLPSLPGADEG